MKDDLFDFGFKYEDFVYFLENLEDFLVINGRMGIWRCCEYCFNKNINLYLVAYYRSSNELAISIINFTTKVCYANSRYDHKNHYCNPKILKGIYKKFLIELNDPANKSLVVEKEKYELEKLLISNTTNSGGKNERRFI